VVRATGGLDDTIEEYDPGARSGNGFKFEEYSALALMKSVERAISFYRRKDHWHALLANAMACDYSWNRSVREYVKLYKKIAGA
jgi:starch synthase